VVRRALRCVQYDAAAREHEESLFEEMEVPPSHATLSAPDPASLEQAVAAGFTVVKLKCRGRAPAEAAFLGDMAARHPQLRWRLDFNESASAEEAALFLTNLSAAARGALDFVEDPCPYEESAWLELRRRTGACLAVDREASPRSSAAKVLVIKPAVDEPLPLAEAALLHHQRVILTSSMDHPLGQAFAAWEAARLGLHFPGVPGICGLQTHHLFEPGPFAELLGPWQPAFTPPPGTGLGFDDLLDELVWTRDY
jgi:O-succinylbenzoate synthase